MNNQSGILNVIDSSRYEMIRFPPVGYLHRYETCPTSFETCKSSLGIPKKYQRTKERRVSVGDIPQSQLRNPITKFKSTIDMPRVQLQLSPSARRQQAMKLKGRLY